MKVKDDDTFALAVVQSSSDKMSVEEKLDLYLKARTLAKKHNREEPTPTATAKTFHLD
ncbi:hypothetical protein JK167_11695 [Levilactobacillus brevis]|uniref:Uncharacterized protein n=1 Tax=Levilactobacillus brevis TaxID=1580 RepID=A0AA41ERD6_LEVBR|nr:hypothetical protein [Levilactobacillus brevis]MBS0948340.1 hypothetical protein [Levilactobacillus brevis]MBS1011485.1 hypothetical protein [Levilactobacillus brevis]